MYNKYFPYSILCILFLGNCAMADLSELIPDEVNNWNKKEMQSYDPETLYKYINGGAELYISYGFEKMVSCTFVRENETDIFIDIFDMQNSYNAFGIFAHFRETIDSTYGQGSQYTFGNLLFWKDKYFISILASPETDDSKEAIKLIAQHSDNKIKETGVIPKIINKLPKENLIQESIRYFRHYIWLNSFYFIADKNILHINESTEAVLAKYQNEKQQSILLLVNYENETDANQAIENFINHYLPELKNNPIQQVEDSSWVGYKMQGKLVTIVFNAAKLNIVEKVLSSI